jgi:hypothetical protein
MSEVRLHEPCGFRVASPSNVILVSHTCAWSTWMRDEKNLKVKRASARVVEWWVTEREVWAQVSNWTRDKGS